MSQTKSKPKAEEGTQEPYAVRMMKFIGRDERGNHTYQLTFNRSLEHTGRLSDIEAGLNKASE